MVFHGKLCIICHVFRFQTSIPAYYDQQHSVASDSHAKVNPDIQESIVTVEWGSTVWRHSLRNDIM